MIEYERLLEKGFSKADAQRTLEIMHSAEDSKPYRLRILDSVLYWVLLIVAIIGNMIISIILIPFLLAFKKVPLYFTIVILASMFGFLFDQLIRDIENIENKHQIMAWAFIPALAVINTFYMVSFTNHLTQTLSLPFVLNSPLIISLVYVAAFTLPYTLRSILHLLPG